LNEAAVKYLNWENAYEKDIWGNKCIGVIKDFNFASQHNAIAPLFISFTETSSTFSIKISPQNIPSTIKQIEEIWKEMFPEFPFEYKFVDDIFNEHYKNEERLTKLLGYFAIFSIFIACLGLFGLISFMAEQRTKEIGVRKVNGANIRDIIFLFSNEFIQLILISGIIAIPLSYYILSKWLQDFAYATNLSWWVFAVSIIIAVIISTLSIFYRALRAASQNPVDALRYE
jgi:putative ABC transport system permease protein